MPATAVAAALLAPAPAVGHEVLHAVERGRAVAVRALYADGQGLSEARYQVFSPAGPAAPWQEGRTDRAGWLSFVPDAAGTWRVKVADASGHGFDIGVDVDAGVATAAAGDRSRGLLRAGLGLAAVGAALAILGRLLRRRRGAAGS